MEDYEWLLLYSPRNSKTMKRIIFDFWGNEDKSIQWGQINEKMWNKFTRITQEEIKEIELKLENLPSKKSNLAVLDEKILSLLENPRQFWESINTKQKRRLQDVLFPDGLHYSPKTTEYRTSNIHLLLEITGCFIDTWTSEKNKTRRQNVFGSRVVDILEKRSKVNRMDEPNQIEWIITGWYLPLAWIFCSEYSEQTFGITCNSSIPMFSVSSRRHQIKN